MPRVPFALWQQRGGSIEAPFYGVQYSDTANCDYTSETPFGVSRRKPKGWIPPTPYSFERYELRPATGTQDIKVTDQNHLIYRGAVGAPANPFRAFNSLNHFNEIVTESDCLDNFPDVYNAALISARNNLKSQKVNLGVAFGERKKTAQLIGDTASSIARSIRMLRRGETRNAMRELGITSKRSEPRGSNVPRKWLELQYGWKPLLSDVYGSVDALSKRPGSDWSVTAKGRSAPDKKVFRAERKPGQWYNFDGFSGTASGSSSAVCRIDAIPQNEAIISLGSLGVTNPLTVAWELVPFSFVADWFIPVGNYVNSLDAMIGYGDAWACISAIKRGEWSTQGLSEHFPDGTFIVNSWSGRKKIVRLVRSVSNGVPLPVFPSFKDPRSLGHMANGLALLTQIFR